MNIYKKILVIFFIFLSHNALSLENKILFKVDNEIITSLDLLDEIKYLNLTNNNINNLSQEKIFEISKNSIIREKIKLIELNKRFENFNVEEKYFNFLIEGLIKKLNLENLIEFKTYLNERNIKYENIKKKIKIEILWNQLIYTKFSKDVRIDKEKIKKEIAKNNFQKEFLFSEILFTLEKNQKLDKKILKIKNDINLNGFENAALIHSISTSAENGGKLNWIKSNSLNKKIKKFVLNKEVGSLTDPIVVPGGFLILKIEDIRETKILNNIDEELKLVENEMVNKQLNQFSNIYFNKIKKEIQINEY
ncbi:peptidylprolyl isomerase [Candidatus Pelagibacter sp.]|nr:peptidylprolyl isomerase [Candidatus Pelagibacter sp.]